jgi:PAS domain S-box-containing protein
MEQRGFLMSPMTLYDLLLSSPSAIIGANSLGEIIYVTAAVQDILGWTVEDLVGQPITKIVPDRLKKKHLEGFDKFIRSGSMNFGGRSLRVKAVCKNGTETSVEITLGSYKTEEGDWRVVSLMRDVQEYVNIEESKEDLRNQLDYAESIIQNLGEGIVSLDKQGIVQISNISAERLLGFSSEELIGKDFHRISHCYDTDGTYKESALCFLLVCFKTHVCGSSQDDFLRKKDGTLLNVSITASPIENGGFVLSFSDITAEKERANELKDSEERYRYLVDISPDPIIVYQRGILVFANEEAFKLVGAETPDQFIGRPVLDFVHPDYHKIVKERMSNVAQGEEKLPLLQERIVKIDGTVVDVEVAAMPIMYKNRRSIMIVARDITDRLQQIARMMRLKVKIRDFSQFLMLCLMVS